MSGSRILVESQATLSNRRTLPVLVFAITPVGDVARGHSQQRPNCSPRGARQVIVAVEVTASHAAHEANSPTLCVWLAGYAEPLLLAECDQLADRT